MIDLSFVGWLTLAAAALLAWVAFPALAPPWRLCAAIACAVLTGFVMLHPPETVLAVPEVATRPKSAPAAKAAERSRPAPPRAQALPVPEAPPAEAPRPVAGPCVGLAGVKKEHCIACGDSAGLTRALCEGAATSRYCSDKTGSDPDCPDASARRDPT